MCGKYNPNQGNQILFILLQYNIKLTLSTYQTSITFLHNSTAFYTTYSSLKDGSNTGAYYRRNLQNHIFTNTNQKYMMLLPFKRGMFAVS